MNSTGQRRGGIVWFNSQTGETQVWYMNGHQLTRRATVLGEDGNPAFIGPPFAIVGIGRLVRPEPVNLAHIFVLMLENRSFDHMLGFSGITGIDAETGLSTTIDGLTGTESNDFHGETYTVATDARHVMPHDPGHSFEATLTQLAGYGVEYPPGGTYPPIDNSGFATSYELGVDRDPDDVMRGYSEAQLPFLHQLAREFVICDNWFGSMPGPTWPNRLFVHAATSGGLDHTPDWQQLLEWTITPGGGLQLSNGTIYDALDRVHGSSPFGSDHYRIYTGDTFPMASTLDRVSVIWDVEDFDDLATDLTDGTLDDVKVIHIEPAYHVPGYAFWDDYANGTSQHPVADVVAAICSSSRPTKRSATRRYGTPAC
jgi:phospholipase C